VDLAAEQGGNCVYTKPNETVIEHGVKIVGPVNLPATLGYHASQLYAKNIHALLQLVVQEGAVQLDMSDDIIEAALITAEKPEEKPSENSEPTPSDKDAASETSETSKTS
jgi:NAD/NADP transhydrogenase alpha subunit